MEIGALIGAGRTSEVFEWEPGKVLKLHYEGTNPEWVHHQIRVDRIVSEAGVQCPKVFDSITLNGRLGIVWPSFCQRNC